MPESIAKFGFSAGVLSPRIRSRNDLRNYDLGVEEARNWIIDYLGGAFTRNGTEFLDYLQDDDKAARIVRFKFNADIENTYAIVLTDLKIRFLQDGAYILESAVTVTGVTSDTITAAAHGYSNGDWIKFSGRTLEVTAATTNNFKVNTPFGVAFDPSTIGGDGVNAFRIYTITTIYAAADLVNLVFDQQQDEVYITHINYVRKKLTRIAAASWTFVTVPDGGGTLSPTSITLTPSDDGTAGVVYAVGVVENNGIESPLASSSMALTELSVNFTTTAGSLKVSWTPVVGAQYYRVYRSLVTFKGADATFAANLGLLGIGYGSEFIDDNIIPDFTQGPLTPVYPFANGSVTNIDITAGGSSWTKTGTTMTLNGGGSGFDGKVIVDGAGAIIGVKILDPGKDYVSPTVSFNSIDGLGSAATATATASASSGNNPSCSEIVQQRRVYAGTLNLPSALFGSRVGSGDSFDTTSFALANDPYSLSVEQAEETPIRYIEVTTDGLFLFSAAEVIQVRGENDEAITGSNSRARPQTSEGCARLDPIKIDREYLYLNEAKTAVLSLRPSNLPTYFTTIDVSYYSNHYFAPSNAIVSWSWAKSPDNLIWAARADGTFLSCTFVSAQQVWAWADHTTKGFVEDVEAVSEANLDRLYMIVRRTIGGVEKRFIERQSIWNIDTVDEMWSVDCGLATSLIKPAATLTPAAFAGTGVVITAGSAVFVSGDVGKILRVGGGRGVVVSFTSTTKLVVDFGRDIIEPIKEFTAPRVYASGEWSLDATVTTVSGLQHLEGETVEILGDGAVLDDKTVVNGAVALSTASSFAVVGLGFTGELKTLPASVPDAVIEDKRKSTNSVAVRLYKSRGLEIGDGTDYYELTKRSDEPYGIPPDFVNEMVRSSISTRFDLDGSITIKKVKPVQAHVLGLITTLEIGND